MQHLSLVGRASRLCLVASAAALLAGSCAEEVSTVPAEPGRARQALGDGGVYVVKDLRTLPGPNSSSYTDWLLATDAGVFFTGVTEEDGRELYRISADGGAPERISSIGPGSVGHIQSPIWHDGMVYFTSLGGDFPGSLWATDGTLVGTYRVPMGAAEPATGSYTWAAGDQATRRYQRPELTSLGGVVYFAGWDLDHGVELWRTDGTQTGTFLVKDIYPGPDGGSLQELTAAGGRLYFVASDGVSRSLWVSDGTEPGTVKVTDLAGTQLSGAQRLTPLGTRIVFEARDSGARSLWIADGTPAGTQPLHAVTFYASYSPQPNRPLPFPVLNGQLLFLGSQQPMTLWKSDGTVPGTQPVSSFAFAVGDHQYDHAVIGGQTLVLPGSSSGVGIELWRTDGTAAGTSLVADIQPGSGSSGPRHFRSLGNIALFTADDGIHGRELWVTDGTPSGTSLLADVRSGPSMSAITYIAEQDGLGWFGADDGVHGHELWRTDGTPSGTEMVADLRPAHVGSDPAALLDLGTELAFIAGDDQGSRFVFATDGTEQGTRALAAVPTAGHALLVSHQGLVFFTADAGTGTQLWRTDGTAAGTIQLTNLATDPNDEPRHLTSAGAQLYFMWGNDAGGALWMSDGTVAGTQPVPGAPARVHVQTHSFAAMQDGTLFFVGADAGGRELWKTDGTSAGTQRVVDLIPGDGWSYPQYFAVMGGALYFTASDVATGRELWKTDGTASGTVLVADMVPGSGSSSPLLTYSTGSALYFWATTQEGSELWVSDGTVAGTRLVRDIFPGAASSSPYPFAHVGQTLYFTATDGVHGRELWRSDGTAAGTTLVADVKPGEYGSVTAGPYALGAAGPIVFSADDGVHGVELWISSGTAGSTFRVTDLATGSGSSNPSDFAVSNGTLYFAATNDTVGRELHAVSLTDLLSLTPLEISCPPRALLVDQGSGAALPVAEPEVTARTGAAVTVGSMPPAGELLGVGIHSVLLTATDAHGNSASCSWEVTVEPAPEPPDAGSPEPDAGMPEPDAGMPETDGGVTGVDAGISPESPPSPPAEGCNCSGSAASALWPTWLFAFWMLTRRRAL